MVSSLFLLLKLDNLIAAAVEDSQALMKAKF